MKHLEDTDAVRGTVDDTLNSILETLESLEYGHFTDALRYITLVEEGMKKIREQAIFDAALGGTSATAMSEAIGGSRQTFYNKYAPLVKKAKEQREASMTEFNEFTDSRAKRSTIRFIDGEIRETAEPLEASYEPLDDMQQEYEKNLRRALESQLTAPDCGRWHEVITKALLAHVLPTSRVLAIKAKAERYATGAYLTDENGEPMSFVDEGAEFFRLAALDAVNPQKNRRPAMREAWKAMMDAEDAAYKKEHPNKTDPLSGLVPPARPAISKLPENLIEKWRKYQADAKTHGAKATQAGFAKLYGVSRSTFARALKRAEAEQNAQK